MLVTDDPALYDRTVFLRDHGRARGDRTFRNLEVAFKYKMSALQAALGLAQLERVEELVGRKREIFGWYRDEFKGTEGVVLNAEEPFTKNSFWMVTAVLDKRLGLFKEDLMEQLSERNIDSRPFFSPLSSLPAYETDPEARRAQERNRVSYRISPYGINLPSPLNLTRDKAHAVGEALKEIIACGCRK